MMHKIGKCHWNSLLNDTVCIFCCKRVCIYNEKSADWWCCDWVWNHGSCHHQAVFIISNGTPAEIIHEWAKWIKTCAQATLQKAAELLLCRSLSLPVAKVMIMCGRSRSVYYSKCIISFCYNDALCSLIKCKTY